MLKYISLFIFSIFLITSCSTPETKPVAENKKFSRHEMDSMAKADKDSLRMVKLKATAYFPLLKAGDGSGVLPVEGVDEIPDPNRQYNLLFEFTTGPGDTTNKKKNPGLKEIARILNLHVASGIPLNHIHPIILTHGKSLNSILNTDAFRKKYKTENPNDSLITEMMNDGAKFIACGQAMRYFEIKKEDLHAGVKVSLTAQTVKSNYLGQGYVLYDISDDK
jgi:intracellular sulfur oxidation DsrE/DsrF family protein